MSAKLNNLNTFEVEIGGIHLRLRSPHSEQTVMKVVDLVNEKIKQALPLTQNESIQTAAILACFNMGEELVLLKDSTLIELQGIEATTENIISELESRKPRLGLDH